MLIAARNAMMAGGWRNPYVTDGCILNFNAVWNAGGGKHDANTNTWVDLSGNGFDCTFLDGTNGSHTIAQDHITFSSSQAFSNKRYDWTGNTSGITIECVSKNTNVAAGFTSYGSGTSAKSRTGFSLEPQTIYFFPQNVHTGDIVASGLNQYSFCAQQGPEYHLYYIYRNYDKASNNQNTNVQMTGTTPPLRIGAYGTATGETTFSYRDGDYYALRVYNKVLSDAERAKNYAADKALFNLP